MGGDTLYILDRVSERPLQLDICALNYACIWERASQAEGTTSSKVMILQKHDIFNKANMAKAELTICFRFHYLVNRTSHECNLTFESLTLAWIPLPEFEHGTKYWSTINRSVHVSSLFYKHMNMANKSKYANICNWNEELENLLIAIFLLLFLLFEAFWFR